MSYLNGFRLSDSKDHKLKVASIDLSSGIRFLIKSSIVQQCRIQWKEREKRFYGEKCFYPRILFTTSLNQRSANTETNPHGHSFTFFPDAKKAVFLCLLLKTKEYTWCYAITIIINPFFNEKKTQLRNEQVFFLHLQHTQCMKKMSSQQNSWKESKLSVSINTKVKFEIYIANEWHYCF